MTNRLLVAFGAALLLVTPALAQTPPATPLTPVSQIIEMPVPASGEVVSPMAGLPNGKEQFWITGDYLFSFVRGGDFPALVTTSPAGTPKAAAGVLGQPNTSTLFGGKFNDNLRSGFRMDTGCWFDVDRTLGLETGFMIVESQSAIFSRASDGTLILARPFTDATSGTQQSILVAFPGQSTGSIDARASSGNLYEWHIDLTENIFDKGWVQLNSLVGYRFYRYDEGLRVRQVVNPTDPNFTPGTAIINEDNFSTQNTFHGLDLGLRTRFFWDNLSLDVLGKLAAGRLTNQVNIFGSQTVTVPGLAPVVNQGGFLALQSNSGRFKFQDWTVMPEVGLNGAWQVNPNVCLRLGYSVLFLDGVARAGNQVDVTLNPNLFPPPNGAGGPNRPAFQNLRTDVWVQSINLGVEFRY